MNKINELIAQYCPNGVEFKELGEVCKIADNKRKPIKSSLRVAGETPYYGANNIQDYVDGYTHDGEYVLLAEDGSASLKNYSVQYATGKFWANNHVHVIKGLDEVLNRFLFHWFRNMNFIPFLSGGTRAKLTKAKMLEILIPLPPLPVQEEIVNILDKFTELEAELETELEAELKARHKQYEYYRNQLLTPVEVDGKWLMNGVEVEWKIISKICKNIVSGGTPLTSKTEYYNGNIPWLRTQEVDWVDIIDTSIKITEEGLNNSSAKWIPPNCVIVAMYGATAAKVAVNKIPLTTNQACCNLEIDEKLANYRFVYYWLCNEYKNLKALGEGSQSNINSQKIKKFQIPIPPLSEQERIVEILDKFDKLVNDISEGLPAEIEARRKQYEYYRGKLLNFKKVNE